MNWAYKSHKMSVSGFFSPNVDTSHLDEVLNWFGAQGWELVSTVDINAHQGGSRELLLLFKRPIGGAAVPPIARAAD